MLLPVIPHEGIGLLKLGMSPDQIFDALKQLHIKWDPQDKRKMRVVRETNYDGRLLKYRDACSFFAVKYIDNQAVEIAVDNTLKHFADVTLYNIDVFKTPAEELVSALKKFGSCSCDSEDEQLGTEYEFHDIGIRLWKEEPFHKKLLSDKAYMEEMKLCINDMFQYLYFQVVTVIQ